MELSKNKYFHIARLITFALVLELALFPHAGKAAARIDAFALQPTILAQDISASVLVVIPPAPSQAEARIAQALPDIEELSPKRTRRVIITAYSSTPDQTDDTPFVTANGTRVRDGIIAANFLRFGTQVKIPELYGGKVFYVTDRMHKRFSDRVDIWMESREEAKQFGVKVATIEVY